MKTSLVKMAGKAGYCCKIFVGGRHVATVADPERTTQEGARAAASFWNRNYRRKLRID